MAAGIEKLVTSRTGLSLAVFLARSLPAAPGYAFAGWMAKQVTAQRQAPQVRAVRANQWVAGGETLSPQALDARVQAVYQIMSRSIYEVYHYMQRPAAARHLFVIEESFQQLIQRPKIQPPGLVLAGLHSGSFNLGLQLICHQWLTPLVLTVPDPRGPLKLEFEIRRRTGMNLVPSNLDGIRQAAHYLEQGGMVLTGLDRPVPGSQLKPRFFNRPSNLPHHHISLALKTGAQVMLVFNRLQADGKYHFYASPPIDMDHLPNREEELRCNTEKVLAVAEDFLRPVPEQWIMTHPVWPDVMAQVP